jgi:gliding motility-associated-like protein
MKQFLGVFNVTKTRVFVLALLLVFVTNTKAQIDVPIGTGTVGNTTTTYPNPMQDYFEGSRSQFLYLASELVAGGMTSPGFINSIKYNVITLNTGTFPAVEQYTIRIGGSSVTTLGTTTWENVPTTVFGPIDYTPVIGINTLTFSSPFFWNGTDNIIIEICNGDPNNATYISYTQNPLIPWTTGLSFNGSHSYRADDLGNLCGSATTTNTGTQTTRPNIIFNWTPGSPCVGTPIAGTATSTSTNILCAGLPFTLALTGNTLASGLTYQWQSASLAAGPWANITGGNSLSFTTTQIATTLFYRCIVTCTNGGSTSNSTSIQVNSVSGPTFATIPFIENFENTWINSCGISDVPGLFWKNTPFSGNTSWRRQDDATGTNTAGWTSPTLGAYTPTASSGTNSARFHSYASPSGSSGSLDLYLNCNTTDPTKKVDFDIINAAGSDSLTILFSTDGGTTFTRIDSAGLSATWRTKTVYFTSSSATTILRFRASVGGTTFGSDYGLDNIRINNFASCVGTPVAGTATSTLINVVCPGTSFTLDLSGGSSAAGLTYQWQSSTTSTGPWNNIVSGTTLPFTTTQSVASLYYQCIVTCSAGGATAASSSILITASPTSYATLPFTESFENTWINGCGISDIPNLFWKNTPFTGNTSWRRNDDAVSGGNTAAWVNPTLGAYTPPASVGSFSARFHSYQASSGTSGNFDLYLNCNTPDVTKLLEFDYINTSGTDTLTVLLSTDGGLNFLRLDSTRLSTIWRTKSLFFNSTSATTVIRFKVTSDFGVTDYGIDNIKVNNFPNCSGAPNAGTATTTQAAIICPGAQFTLGLTGSSVAGGLTYQWQSAVLAAGPWANILGATNISFTTTQIPASLFYRCVVTCAIGSISSNSIPVQVTSVTGPSYTTLPFTESFENTWINGCATRDVPNTFWKNTPATGNTSWRRVDDGLSAAWTTVLGAYTPTASDGIFSARFHSYNAPINSTGDFDLHINCNTSSPNKRLTFNFINTSGTDSLSILLSTNGGTSFVRLDSAGLSSVWNGKEIFFTSASATTVLRFRAFSDDGLTDIGLDNIVVSNWANCSGNPITGTVNANPLNACAGQNITLSSTGVDVGPGVTYQWQVSTNGGTTWVNIPGATSFTATTTQILTSQYRLLVTCTLLGGGTSTSTSITVTSPTLPAGTYTINKNNPTTWPGAGAASNFNSFNAAYAAVACGIGNAVVFNVVPGSGPYTEQLIINGPVGGATATRTITFNGNGNTIAFASANSNERAVIKLKNTKYFIFDSLTVDATAGTFGFGFHLTNNADSNVIRKCTINSSTTAITANFAGIAISGTDASAIGVGTTLSDFNTIDRNTINGGLYGVTLTATFAGGANGFNRITNNNITNFYQYGIYVAASYNTLIEGNTISRPTRTDVGEFNGIFFTTQSNTATISKNRIVNPFGGNTTSALPFYGINFATASSSAGNDYLVVNNLIAGTNGNGLQYGMFNTATNNVNYIHNTIALDDLTSTSTLATRGFFHTGTAPSVLFYNNIVSITRGGTGSKHCTYWATSLLNSNNNNFYINAAAGTNSIGFFTTDRPTLLSWRTATVQDDQSFDLIPVYFNTTALNYSPSNAGIDNRGFALGIADDINSAPRSVSTPDLGAFEFTAPGCTAPPLAGTTTITPTTICQNSNVLLNLVIGPYGASQTFQWQSSATLAGTYTNVGNPKLSPDTTILSSTTLYYRCEIKCGGSTVYSTPVLLTVNPALPAGAFTINKNLPTNWPATLTGANFNSFNDAKASMGCGVLGAVTFNVVANTGPYAEQLILDSVKNVTAINTVTFNGNGNTIAFSSTNTNERAVIKFKSADHFRLDSLTIDATGPNGFGYGVQLINNADSNIVRKCTILANTVSTTANYVGVVINSLDGGPIALGNTWCDFNRFDRNIINGGFYGATIVGSATQLINNNQFTNNTIREFYNAGLYVGGTRGTLIESNLFTRPTRTGLASGYGIFLSGAVNQAALISKNRITNFFGAEPTNTNTAWGIYHNSVGATAGSENIVSNNLIYTLDANGPSYGIYNVGSANISYFHNTIAMDNTTSTSNGETAGFYQTTLASGIIFRNNIVTITRGGTGSKYAMNFVTTTSTIESNNNDFFIQAPGLNNFIGRNGTTNYTTLGNWITGTTKDANSLNFDPIYNNPTTGDYKPLALSIDNKGTNLGITSDILNLTRSTTTPDIGAYEFAPAPCPSPLLGGTASVTPNSGLCLEQPIRLSLSGNSPAGALTFQWQHSLNGTTGWTNIGPLLFTPTFDTLTSVNRFYRCLVACGPTTTTLSTITQVNLNSLLAGGTYTIDGTQPTTWPAPGGTNFQTFQAAVNAMLCGIQSSVVFDVRPGTYTEQIRIPNVPGTSANTTVTFKAQNGNPASAQLTFASTNAAINYTLRLDSARYIYFRNLTIAATNSTNGRAVEFANTASFDSLTNCIINAPIVTTTNNTVAAIFANSLRGTNIVIKGNTIANGSMGMFVSGTSAVIGADDLVIDSNFVSGAYFYGIYSNFTKRLKLNKNTINVGNPIFSSYYGIYSTDNDSSYQVMNNKINISNTAGSVYGIYIRNSDGSANTRGLVNNNDVIATTGNTSNLWGIYVISSPFITVANNAISINTTGNASYGLYNDNSSNGNYYNNSVNSVATSTANNHAAYFLNTSAININVNNNIFSHKGSGRALFIANASNLSSNYNMLFSSGTNLVQSLAPVAANYSSLLDWTTATFQDKSSIVYNPAFVSDTDLKPNLNNVDVWAIHGRGVQIDGNNRDHDNVVRPTTLIAGVPDLGAYEFFPNVLPTVLSAIPANPSPNTEQTFYYGSDTVMKIKWSATAPPSVQIRRYSGVVPTGLATGNLDSMYFYTKVDIPGGGTYDYDAKLYYVDSWLGSIPQVGQLGLGKTTPGNAWVVGFSSRVDLSRRMIYQTNVNFLDRFTGLINPYAPPVLPDKDSSNTGRRFWFAYAANQLAGGATQEMVAYLSATTEAANVQVKINGTNWVRNYFVPANTVVVTENLPKAGADNAFLNTAGLFDRGISITSDVPIVAYAHGIGSTSSGACMLMPVGVWGYEYKTLGITQLWGTGGNSFFYVMADTDNTRVEITPSVAVSNAGMAANTTTIVTLNKGQVLQVIASSTSTELTGSIVKSVPNSAGKCFPIATFSGSSRTQINQPAGCSSGGDFMMQQNFPSSAWGRKYLLAPTSLSGAANTLAINIWRIAVKDPTTVVRRNGVQIPLATLVNNQYYQINGATAEFIEADKPITIAQFLTGGTCGGTGVGDPEMIYISPIEQGIKKVGFYRNNRESIQVNYLTMIVPTNGMASLKIRDGNALVLPDFTYPHPQNASLGLNGVNYTVVVKRWPSAAQQVKVECDSTFTGITYGLGSVESYGYNMGTLVKNLQALGNINNTLSPTGNTTEYTCAGAPFKFTMLLPVIPTSIIWKFSQVPFLNPNADVTIASPVPTSTVLINGTLYYKFTLTQDYVFSNPGLYPVQITYTHPTIESCDNTQTDVIYVQVIPSPGIGFNITFAGCAGNTASFAAQGITVSGVNASSWTWTFHNPPTQTGQNTTYTYPNPGTFNVKLSTVTADGCLSDSTRPVVVNPSPVVNVVTDSFAICSGGNVTFTIQSPTTGTVYNWYTAASGGSPVFVGTTYNLTNVIATQAWFIEGISVSGCISSSRRRVVAQVFSILAKPVVTVNPTLLSPNSITFQWAAVPGVVRYEVSINNGTTWVAPSSGNTGLSHVVSGLTPNITVTILVRAVGTITCQTSTSDAVTAKTLIDQIYVPSAFNPNSPNPVNRILRVYGYIIQSMQFMVFNQWGEKVFETTNQTNGWDGTFKGKSQPSGVYIYVLKMTLQNGTQSEMKGSINLIR